VNLRKYLILITTAALFIVLPVWAQVPLEAQSPKSIQQITAGDDYIIGVGDVLDIALWRDDALVRQVVVLADGKISFPLIGEVVAAGKTIAELKKEIVSKLINYVPDPVLSIEVKQANSMLVYVIGRVNNQNRFPVNANVTVLQALSIAGGLNPFAKKNKIKIFRQEGDKTLILSFKYDEVVKGINIEQNIALRRGDVIVVP
jgi:polysaccharide export outer membrane protein